MKRRETHHKHQNIKQKSLVLFLVLLFPHTDCRIPVPMVANSNTPPGAFDTGTRRRLFAGFRPLSGFGRGRLRSAQHRSISLPESNLQCIIIMGVSFRSLLPISLF